MPSLRSLAHAGRATSSRLNVSIPANVKPTLNVTALVVSLAAVALCAAASCFRTRAGDATRALGGTWGAALKDFVR
jgi:hypothetical protein